MDIDVTVKRLCTARNITRRELAIQIGVGINSLSRSLKRDPKLSTLISIATVLSVPLTDLFADSSTPPIGAICPHCGNTIELNIK